MSEKSKSTIDRAKALEVFERVDAANPGKLAREDKTGWIKVTSNASKNRVYIQNRDDVREVHLSGWGKDYPGTVAPPKANGKVQAHIDMDGDALATLEAALTELANQVATEPAKKEKSAAPKAEKAPKAAKKPATDQDRVQRIKERAAALGLDKKLEEDQDGEAVDPAGLEAAVDEASAAEQQ